MSFTSYITKFKKPKENHKSIAELKIGDRFKFVDSPKAIWIKKNTQLQNPYHSMTHGMISGSIMHVASPENSEAEYPFQGHEKVIPLQQ